MPIFNLGYGLSPLLIGIAAAIPRFVDAFTDPLMGSISDNTRSKWGRRRPYMIVGVILCALCFPFIWLPPFAEDTWVFAWLTGSLIVMTLAYTTFSVPTLALGYELTTDYDERTRVMAWRLYLSVIAGMTAQWFYKLLLLPAFGGTELEGVRYVGPLVALVVLLTGLPAGLFCKERIQSQAQPIIRLRDALKMTARNKPFLRLMATYILVVLATTTVGSLGMYVNIFYVCEGDRNLAATIGGWFGTAMILSTLVGMWAITKLSQWTNKRTGMLVGLAFAFIGNLSLWVTMTPANPWLQIISAVPIGFGIQGCWLMVDSMLADICDEDEVLTNMRREGIYAAVKGFCLKIALAATSLSAGGLLVLSGFDIDVPVTDEVSLRMKVMLVSIQCVGLLVAALLIKGYPLDRAMAEGNRLTIESRNPENSEE